MTLFIRITKIKMKTIPYLKVINTLEILHPAPHDPHLVGDHLSVFVEDVDHYWLLVEPEWVLEGATPQDPLKAQQQHSHLQPTVVTFESGVLSHFFSPFSIVG